MLLPLATSAADEKWYLVTDGGENILMSRIGFLLVSDDADEFSVVCSDGSVYNNVTTATFAQFAPTGISEVKADDEVKLSMSATVLTLSGCADGTAAAVYSADGKQMVQKVISASDNTVQIGSLPAGVYILKAGKTSVKFSKR